MQNELGDTPLHVASCGEYIEVMTILLQRGANVNSLNKVCIYYIPSIKNVCLNLSRVCVCV